MIELNNNIQLIKLSQKYTIAFKEEMQEAFLHGFLAPDQHLANKNVELWMMPAKGGKPKLITKLFGGQGTINTNSWAPDSRRVAFVSYRLKEKATDY